MPAKALTYNQRMKKAREDAGLSLREVQFRIYDRFGDPLTPSVPTLNRLEHDADEKTISTMVLTYWLAEIYGVKHVSDLSEFAAEQLDEVRSLLDGLSRC